MKDDRHTYAGNGFFYKLRFFFFFGFVSLLIFFLVVFVCLFVCLEWDEEKCRVGGGGRRGHPRRCPSKESGL